MKDLIQTGAAVDLEYDEGCAALAGRINGLSTAIKENEKTGTYGALMWVSCAGDPSGAKLDEFLKNEVAEKPHIIRHYKVSGRGAAVALVKYNDALRNINNIRRFMGELSDSLRDLSYVNCCYNCGATENLGIYNDSGVPVQYCSACAKGSLIVAFRDEPVPEKKPEPEVPENAFDDKAITDLLADPSAGSGESYDKSSDRVISTGSDNADISGFMLTEQAEDEKTGAPRSEIFEAAQKEFDEQKAKEAEKPAEPDHSFDELMFTESAVDAKPAAEPEVSAPRAEAAGADSADLGDLMFTEHEEAGSAPGEKKAPEEQAGDINSLMFSEERAQRAADVVHLEEGEKLVTEITALMSGAGEDLKAETDKADEEEEIYSDDIEVTEYHDDSNDGEDIDVTELDSKINEPTDSSGGEIVAEDVPLENDGSVPLINPGLKTTHPSSVYEPNAVRAYVGGTYDNATASDEPVGFDGRRKGDTLRGDPRGNDEFTETKKTGITSVSRPAKPSKPSKLPQNYSSTVKAISYSGDSKPIVGGIAALLFGLIGAALWAGSGYLFDMMKLGEETSSWIMPFCALLITVLAFVGYRVGGDCFDTKGIIISSVISVIIDVAGAAGVFITSEFRWSQANLSYCVPFNMAIERMMHGITGHSDGPLIYGKLFIIGGVMIVSLVAAIFIAKKKS